jgi:ferredoxin
LGKIRDRPLGSRRRAGGHIATREASRHSSAMQSSRPAATSNLGAARVARVSPARPRGSADSARARASSFAGGVSSASPRYFRLAAARRPRWSSSRRRAPAPPRAGLSVTQDDNRLVDFYELLGVADDADIKTIKRAYYDMAMYCHPDRSGDEGNDMCVVLNEAYAILKDPIAREMYDAELSVQREDDEDEFTGLPYSKWTTKKASPGETRAVFVDEFTCIGCKQCVWAAPATFRMDDDYGRSRVFAQWLNTEEDIDCAIASCPVDCIHWVQKEQLPYLEHVTRFVDKVSVGIMQSGQGRQSVTDPFDAAYAYQKFRERKIESRRAKLEEERRDREWRAQREAEKAGAGGDAANESSSSSGPTYGQRRAYRGAADKIRRVWSEGTGVKIDEMKRRRWADSGATIPLERSLVPVERETATARSR